MLAPMYTLVDRAELEDFGIRYDVEIDRSRISLAPLARLSDARAAAVNFRHRMLSGKRVRYYQTFNLVRVPYPTRYGLLNAAQGVSPFMHILNRLTVVQFDSTSGLKTLLFSPSDIDANAETPFFKNFKNRAPSVCQPIFERIMAPRYASVASALASVNISPEEVDYISYDHLHTQDIRRWLGSGDQPGFFPNAKLLVMEEEWRSTEALLPPQSYWYCPNGIEGVDPHRVIMLENTAILGDGIALVKTPGHTEGNHSLVVHTDEGLLVSSENGVSADNFAPEHSNISGVRAYARATGQEVVLNGNTLERGLDQYISMIIEKTIAGPSVRDGNFFNVVPSSELHSFWMFPGLAPSFSFGELKYGSPVRRD